MHIPVDDTPAPKQREEPPVPEQHEKPKEAPTPEQRRKPTQKKKRPRRRKTLREEEARIREELMLESRRGRDVKPPRRKPVKRTPRRKSVEKTSVPERRKKRVPAKKSPTPRRRKKRTKKAPVPGKLVRKPTKRRTPRPEPPEITRPRPRVPPQENKIVVYTVLFGNEDRLWTPHPSFVHEATFVVFTEKPRREVGVWVDPKHPRIKRGTANTPSPNPVWEQRIVKPGYDNRKSARYYKTLIPELFDEYGFSIWVDANIRLAASPLEAIEDWLGDADIAAIKHLTRTCLYDEAKECISAGKGNKAKITAQTRLYHKEGMPEKWGLPSTRCIIRRHDDTIAQLDESWWQEIEKYSVRDQISLPYIAWKLGIHWNIIPGIRSKAFWFIRHGELPR